MNQLLEVKDLHTVFHSLSKKVYAVRGVSFALYPGETLAIVGESGCGKSVMAKTLTRLLPSITAKIEQGQVIYKGEDLLQKTEREMRKIRGQEIGMIFQDPMTSLNPIMKIGSQITEGYRLHHPEASKKEMYERAIELLTRVGIPQPKFRYSQYPHELSGGMRQRVIIAIAMISSPHLLIADEPTTALDVTIQAQILELLKEIQKKEKMSIILITHNLSIVANFCDRVLVMYAGEIVESGTVEQIYESPKHPYTRRLLHAIPRLDLPVQRNLYSIHGSPPDLSSKLAGCSFAQRCPHAMQICHGLKVPSVEVGEKQIVSCWLYDRRVAMQRKNNER